jgi:hypothetical protein
MCMAALPGTESHQQLLDGRWGRHRYHFCSAAGDQFLILASDGLLEKLSPTEMCATAAAVAGGRPLPLEPRQQPAAIPLGPADTPAAVPPAAAQPATDQQQHQQQQQLAWSRPCRPKPGLVACEDCCGAAQRRAPATAQQVAETLQQAAYERTALDNIAVLVIPLRRCMLRESAFLLRWLPDAQ